MGFDFPKYHPIISHPDIASQIRPTDYPLVLSGTEKFIGNSDYYNLIQKLLERQTFLIGFTGESPRFLVFSDFEEILMEGNSEIYDAFKIIESSCPWLWNNFEEIITSIVPVKSKTKIRSIGGATDYYLTGMIFFSFYEKPFSVEELAISFAHELGHNMLMIYQAGMIPVEKFELDKKVYSGVRKTNRPTLGAFHAAVALGYMVTLCNTASKNENLEESQRRFFSERHGQYISDLSDGLKALSEVKLSNLGKCIVEELNSLK